MRFGRTPAFLLLLACTLISRPHFTVAAEIPNDRGAVEHTLNRLTFGPRPGDIERAQRLGLSKWLDQQLNPARLDDRVLLERLPAPPAHPTQVTSPRNIRRFGRQSTEALASAKLLRATYSERQLEEVLVDFWFNHFNVFAGKGRTGYYLEEYEREAIRPHVLGRFRDLLGATAKSPAMLFYLDNWLSADPEASERIAALRQRRERLQDAGGRGQTAGRRRGLNENYARELLELHTLGVDGGYTQADIVAVARAFTGWTIGRPTEDMPRRRRRAPGVRDAGVPRRSRAAMDAAEAGSPRRSRAAMDAAEAGQFRFVRALHDTGEKVVLGRTLPGGDGIEEGERVLDMLASHPSTARHIATKLARRFVSDDPPEALVARVAKRFVETEGNIREVVRTLATSPEFFDMSARRAKVKTPLEFVVSAVRATERDPRDTTEMLGALRQLGMSPYMCQPPTGYHDTAETWTSAGALVTRMNVAQQIAGAQAATIGGPQFQRR